MGDSKIRFFILDFVLLFMFLGLIMMIFNFRRIPFIGELFILIFLILFAFIALTGVYKNSNWGYSLLSMVLAATLIDLLFIFYLTRSFGAMFLGTTLLAALGFIISVSGIKRKEHYVEEEVTKTFEPGKYVASKTGSVYHAPNCDWAKKIKKKNLVWFDDEKDAKKKYKAHSCLK